jgi:tetratricopeptide (TPR) repeat protein
MATIACEKNGNTKQANTDIPELLQRSEPTMQGKEWDQVQSFYAENANRLRQNPNDQEALLHLSEIFIQEARVTGESAHYYAATLKVLDKVLADKPKNKDFEFRALANKASVLLSLHQFQMAYDAGKQAVAINPYNAQTYGILVDAQVELGKYKEAVETADKMVSIRPDLRSYSRVSYLRQIHGDNKGAIEAMNLATEAGYPGAENTEWARVTLGDLLLHAGALEQAEEVYQTALANRSQYPYAEIGLAKVEKAKGNYEAAIKHTETAIRIMSLPGFVDLLSDLYELKGDTEKAAEIRKDVVDLLEAAEKEELQDAPVKHNGARELAMAYLKNNELDKALEQALTDLKMRPDNIDANELVAWIYFLQKDYTKAKVHTDKMLATNVKNPNTLYKAGLIYAKAGDTNKGNQLLADAKATSIYLDASLKKYNNAAVN